MTMTFSGTSGVTFPDTTTQTTAATASIPAGAVTNFVNASAPTGWTQVTTYNNYAMRVVSGTGAGTGGSVAFTTAFASQTPAGTISGGAVSAYTLTTTDIPAHSHNTYITPGTVGGSIVGLNATSIYWNTAATTVNYTMYTQNTGGGGSHTHSFTQPSFSGSAINLAVQYVDNILCQKS